MHHTALYYLGPGARFNLPWAGCRRRLANAIAGFTLGNLNSLMSLLLFVVHARRSFFTRDGYDLVVSFASGPPLLPPHESEVSCDQGASYSPTGVRC
jgi:hypothetical protein